MTYCSQKLAKIQILVCPDKFYYFLILGMVYISIAFFYLWLCVVAGRYELVRGRCDRKWILVYVRERAGHLHAAGAGVSAEIYPTEEDSK
jgi:hypothetical protein